MTMDTLFETVLSDLFRHIGVDTHGEHICRKKKYSAPAEKKSKTLEHSLLPQLVNHAARPSSNWQNKVREAIQDLIPGWTSNHGLEDLTRDRLSQLGVSAKTKAKTYERLCQILLENLADWPNDHLNNEKYILLERIHHLCASPSLKVNQLANIMHAVSDALTKFEKNESPDVQLLEKVIDLLSDCVPVNHCRAISNSSQAALGKLNLDKKDIENLRSRIKRKLGIR